MKMKVESCAKCEHTKECNAHYGGLGCKMKEDQKSKPGEKWKENIMKRFTRNN